MQDWYSEDHLAPFKKKRRKVLIAGLIFSVLLHLLSFINLENFATRFPISSNTVQHEPVKIKIVAKDKKEMDDARKHLVETPLQKTEKPKDAKFNSFQDHIAEKEMRMAPTLRERGRNAGERGKANDPVVAKKSEQDASQTPNKTVLTAPGGDVVLSPEIVKRRKERYRSLLLSSKELAGVADAGYQQQLDENIDLGDRVDINTSEYRYMGYFTGMRKAIELVWNYPSAAAQRGMEGEVGVEFVIMKNGLVSRIKVIKSSGYKLLDDAIVEALKLASPFSPLPDGFGKQKMLITGSFRYILSPYVAGAH